ncbi:putative oxidoreductase iron-sulfur subunit [Rhodovulum sp. PH10]|uniref:4Fe-4S dicluster domain-containing protein n=1 Tax=Rhodovulum sp. PH10 TaxID=1187851 RepID=UPI00027C2681|nr:4Fe-4S dicluster domain-containing protein [Rhodovulum sp. PH10]EJW11352.1 putative oxidoreductase iron-sulfur subunit [Rhodovulum sp. PH10]
MTQYAFSLDVSRCTGCRACVVACQDQNDLEGDDLAAFRHVTTIERGTFPDVRIAHVSLACQHCGDAPCIAVCPTRAIVRRGAEGAVLVDENLCIGCHSCALVCPFGAPQFSADGPMVKCDLCWVRLEEGLKPACVQVCATHALDCRPTESLGAKKAEAASLRILETLVRTLPPEPA